VLVDEQAAEKINKQPDVGGPFSNPKIEPFGPPSAGRDK
jgi:hypothetical protein